MINCRGDKTETASPLCEIDSPMPPKSAMGRDSRFDTVEMLCFSHTEIDDMIRKSANQLLTRTLGGCLSSLIKRPNLSLLQVSSF